MRIKLFFLLMLSAQLCFSQRILRDDSSNRPARLTKVELLDKSEFQCVYLHEIYDPELDFRKKVYEILEVGTTYSKYENYGAYQLDSLINARMKAGEIITAGQHSAFFSQFRPTLEYLIKDLKNAKLTMYDRVFVDNFVYEEPVPAIAWKLQPDTQEVCGYVCHKATAEFRGRIWTAWYSDIPLNNGPWKFGNLPGLILKVEDDKKEHRFEAVGFKQDKIDFGYKKRSYMKTTREKFNKALWDYKNRSWQMVEGTEYQPKNPDGSAVEVSREKMFYNLIELE